MAKYTGTLYLIPALLGDSPAVNVLPAYNLDIVQKLDRFIVEDEKTARRMLRKMGFKANFDEVTFYLLNEHTTDEGLIPLIRTGGDIGLLSEAGCPSVADPGNVAVQLAHETGMRVAPLVGPSSILLALMASGFNGQNFTFHGYIPVKPRERAQKLQQLESLIYRLDQTQIIIETPYRNRQLFEAILENCLAQTKLAVALDLTTPDEKILVDTVSGWKKKGFIPDKAPAVFLLYK